jgi:predicted dehydrogenase
LVFENGCVASLSASRVSYQPMRSMQVWSAEGFTALDFASRTATIVRPAEDVARRRLRIDELPPPERASLKDHLFQQHLIKQQLQSEAVDAITAELSDFAESIRTGRSPRVTREQGRDALAVAEQVLRRIQTHLWDGHAGGRTGPHALPVPSVIPSPHWDRSPRGAPAAGERREAG